MTTSTAPLPTGLDGIELGDMLTLPGDRTYTVRAAASLAQPTNDVAGFIVLGELQRLVVPSPNPLAPIGLYGVAGNPASVVMAHGTPLAEGATSYWAPHLPGASDTMGELLWRLVDTPADPAPLIAVWRGEERIIFERVTYLTPGAVSVTRLRRGHRTTGVGLQTAVVTDDAGPTPGAIAKALGRDHSRV